MELKLKDLQNAAKELNALLFVPGDEQEINLKGSADELKSEIKEVIGMLTPEDELTASTQKVIDALEADSEEDAELDETDEAEINDVDDEPPVTTPAPKSQKTPPAPAAKKGAKKENVPTPQELIQAAKSREELVTLLNTYTDLKPLRTAHRNYKSSADLKQVMIAMLNGELKAEEVIGAAKEVGKKNAAAEKKTPAAKKQSSSSPKVKGTPVTKGKGVIATIVESIENAGKKGITKAEILEVLVKEFPEKSADSMKNTINVQVPCRISKERWSVGVTPDGHYYKK
jgi:hypothetical protein